MGRWLRGSDLPLWILGTIYAGVGLALASSSSRRVIAAALDRLGLSDAFAVVHSAEAEPMGKPHPAVYLSTAALLGTDPTGCVAFEDSLGEVRELPAETRDGTPIDLQANIEFPYEIAQALNEVALGILGMRSSLYVGDPHAEDDGKWALGYMNTYTGTISGGSSEIQRNILGERVLGLPKTK